MRLRLEQISKAYDDVPVLHDISLETEDGELLVILGPSGSGKSTLLHAIAGVTPIDAGSIWFGDEDVTNTPPQARETPLVMQRHALFPHLSVIDNVAFGLRMHRVARAEREERARASLHDVQLDGFDARYPSELSGGEAQRVAIARALVTRPRLLLMDEPFSSLDPTLRAEMQELLLDLHSHKRITTIFVTHDQREALRLGDRIVILRDGRVRQVGPAREVYDCPIDEETARFIGLTNIMPGVVRDGRIQLEDLGSFPLPAGSRLVEGSRAKAAFRPENVTLRAREEDVGIPTRIARVKDHGQTVNYCLHFPSGMIEATELGPARLAVGDDVCLALEKAPWLFPAPELEPSSNGSSPPRDPSSKLRKGLARTGGP
jgi:putative spermidine/putrescine transport system ATP-binding protein